MQRLSNDEWASTLHRVVATGDSSRHSLAFFQNFASDSVIAPLPGVGGAPRYAPVSAHAFLLAKHAAAAAPARDTAGNKL